MKTLSLVALTGFLVIWGVSLFVKDNNNLAKNPHTKIQSSDNTKSTADNINDEETLLSEENIRELDKIGIVINEDNVEIDHEAKVKIKTERIVYEDQQTLKEKQVLLEQSFMDQNSSITDIKRLQDSIAQMKNKLKIDLNNSEKWDAKFIYYLMLQENYTFSEIDSIKSLSDNGLTPEEINFITDIVKEDSFMERIVNYKNQNEKGRNLAALRNKPKEKDDFIDDPSNDGSSVESKLVEMNYNQEEKEEMLYGSNQ